VEIYSTVTAKNRKASAYCLIGFILNKKETNPKIVLFIWTSVPWKPCA